MLDDIGIWDEVLSDEEIEALADGEPPITDRPDPGDYDENGVLDAEDLNLQSAEMKKPPGQADRG